LSTHTHTHTHTHMVSYGSPLLGTWLGSVVELKREQTASFFEHVSPETPAPSSTPLYTAGRAPSPDFADKSMLLITTQAMALLWAPASIPLNKISTPHLSTQAQPHYLHEEYRHLSKLPVIPRRAVVGISPRGNMVVREIHSRPRLDVALCPKE
jgi:hypothetical protein